MAYIGKKRTRAQVTGPAVIRTKHGLNPVQKCFDRPHHGTEQCLTHQCRKLPRITERTNYTLQDRPNVEKLVKGGRKREKQKGFVCF